MRTSLTLVAAGIVAHLGANAVAVGAGAEAEAETEFDFYGAGGQNRGYGGGYNPFWQPRGPRLSPLARYIKDAIQDLAVDIFY